MLQTVALGLFILPLKHFEGVWDTVGEVVWWIAALVMAAAVTLTVVTGADYVVKALAAAPRGPGGRRPAHELPRLSTDEGSPMSRCSGRRCTPSSRGAE